MSIRTVAGWLGVFALAAPTAALAQTAVTSGWRDGFVLQSETGDYRLQLGALAQVDGRFALDDSDHTLADTFAFRRVRPVLYGRIARYLDFTLIPDFAGGAVALRNVYLETRFSPGFRIRFGKDKVPFGLERLHSASSLFFVERGLPTAVAPDRDIGVQILGDLAGGAISYAAGVFNGVADGASADVDTNDGKDVAARIVVRPFVRATGRPLQGLGLGLAVTRGSQTAALPSFRTSGQQIFFAYDSNAVGDGVRSRISPQAYYYYKAFGAFGEYVHSTGHVSMSTVGDDIDHDSWQLAGSFVLSGEPASERGVRPTLPFDPAKGHWGALQLALRYHALSVDERVLSLGLGRTGARQARAFGAGANWYFNPHVKWVFNVERTTFDGGVNGNRPRELLIAIRNQLSF